MKNSKEALEYLFGLALFYADEEQHKKCREANKIIYEDLKKLEKYEKIYELIKQKKENAINHKQRNIDNELILSLNDTLEGEIDAYTDVLCLIESSKELTKIIFKTKDGRLLEKSPNSHYASGYDGKGYYLYRENGEDKLICSDNVIDIIEVAIESSGVLDDK